MHIYIVQLQSFMQNIVLTSQFGDSKNSGWVLLVTMITFVLNCTDLCIVQN